jgi:hypothetical protein
MRREGIRDLLARPNPLTRNVALKLIGYAEEDDCVDFKQTLDVNEEREWLEFTKDVAAFANTHGGYLVLGVEDSSKDVVGLAAEIAQFVKDANRVQQKVNRHLEPPVAGMRSQEFRVQGKRVIVVHVPRSHGRTHVMSKDGEFKYPSGDKRRVFSKGTVYVRRSAGNHLMDSRDLDDLVERRIEQFRDALFDKVSRVVASPVDSQVFVLSQDADDAQRFIIEDSPDAIPVKGMSFTVSPEGPEQEIAAWAAMCPGGPTSPPPATVLWGWYNNRESVHLSEAHRLAVFKFSLWASVPALYWVQGVKRDLVLESLTLAARNPGNPEAASAMLVVAKLLGRGAHSRVIGIFGKYASRLSHEDIVFSVPAVNRALGDTLRRERKSDAAKALARLNAIAADAAAVGKEPGIQARWEAQELDRFLYAEVNRYR